jgi:hypothetical protein
MDLLIRICFSYIYDITQVYCDLLHWWINQICFFIALASRKLPGFYSNDPETGKAISLFLTLLSCISNSIMVYHTHIELYMVNDMDSKDDEEAENHDSLKILARKKGANGSVKNVLIDDLEYPDGHFRAKVVEVDGETDLMVEQTERSFYAIPPRGEAFK